MKTIVVGTMKGGTGKTTMTFNLAGLLSENKRVLLWDIDPQCNLSQSAGMDLNTRDGYTTMTIFEDQTVCPQDVVVNLNENLSIIPGSIDLTVMEARLPGRAGKELILKYYIEDNAVFFDQYDYIIFDTSPSMSCINQNGFVAADSIVLISDVSFQSVRGVELFQFLWNEVCRPLRIPDTIKALVLNNYDSRIKMAQELMEFCLKQDHLSSLMIPTVIPSRVIFKKSTLEGKPVSELEPSGEATSILRHVIDDLTEKGVF